MADDKAKTGLIVGGSAALGTALVLLLSRKAAAAPPPVGEITLDEAAMLLLQSIAQSGVSIDADASEIINAINRLAAALGVSVLQNPFEISSFVVRVAAVNVPVQLPGREIPYGKALVIKALNTNGGLIRVANSRPEALNVNSSYWLIGNEAIEYEIKNSEQLWINATVAGEGVVCTVEQKGRG